MNRIASCAVIIGLTFAGTASGHFRSFEQPERRSYELVLESATLPGSSAGTIIVHECPTCEPRSLRVNAATRYFVNGGEHSFADFTRAVATVRAAQSELPVGLYLDYDLESRTVATLRVVQFSR